MRSARILLAEDNPDLRELLVTALESDGHRVHQVTRGDDLLHHLIVLRDRNGLPDLVISDVDMPGMLGLEALELAGIDGESLPLVLMTGSDISKITARAARLCVQCILRKPLDLDAFRGAVLALLGWRQPV